MSDTATRIPEDIKTAMKAKDTVALNALRALKSALMNAAIEKGNLSIVLDESEVLAVIRKQIKQRVDSCEQFGLSVEFGDFSFKQWRGRVCQGKTRPGCEGH